MVDLSWLVWRQLRWPDCIESLIDPESPDQEMWRCNDTQMISFPSVKQSSTSYAHDRPINLEIEKTFTIKWYSNDIIPICEGFFNIVCTWLSEKSGKQCHGNLRYTRSAPVIIGGTQIINESTIVLKFVIEFSHLCLDINW